MANAFLDYYWFNTKTTLDRTAYREQKRNVRSLFMTMPKGGMSYPRRCFLQ